MSGPGVSVWAYDRTSEMVCGELGSIEPPALGHEATPARSHLSASSDTCHSARKRQRLCEASRRAGSSTRVVSEPLVYHAMVRCAAHLDATPSRSPFDPSRVRIHAVPWRLAKSTGSVLCVNVCQRHSRELSSTQVLPQRTHGEGS